MKKRANDIQPKNPQALTRHACTFDEMTKTGFIRHTVNFAMMGGLCISIQTGEQQVYKAVKVRYAKK